MSAPPVPVAPEARTERNFFTPLSRSGGWTARLLRALVGALYLGFAFALSFVLGTKSSDLDVFFWPAAQLAAHGHPLLIYSIQSGPYPNANGPLALVPLTAVAVVADALGWAANPTLRDGLVLAASSLFTLLAAREATRLVEEAGVHGRGVIIYAALCLSVPLWLALGSFGHVEIPLEIWLTMMALRLTLKGRVAMAGLVLGLVLLSRSAALVLVIGIALLNAAGPATLPQRSRRVLSVLAIAASTMLLGLAPFLLTDSHAVISSLLSFRGSLPISGGSVWVVLARGLPWSGVVQHDDAGLMAVAAFALVGLLAIGRRGIPFDLRGGAAALTVAACCVPLLAKTTWAYYLAEPYAFAVVAVVGRPGRLRPAAWGVPLLLSLASLILVTSGLSTPPDALQIVVGPVAGAAIAAAIFIVMRDSGRAPEVAAPAVRARGFERRGGGEVSSA